MIKYQAQKLAARIISENPMLILEGYNLLGGRVCTEIIFHHRITGAMVRIKPT